MSMNNVDENTVYVSYWNQLGLGILIFPSNLGGTWRRNCLWKVPRLTLQRGLVTNTFH